MACVDMCSGQQDMACVDMCSGQQDMVCVDMCSGQQQKALVILQLTHNTEKQQANEHIDPLKIERNQDCTL